MSCFNFGGGNCCWIIILILILFCCCGNNGWGGNDGCGNNNGCGCGCGFNNWWWIIILRCAFIDCPHAVGLPTAPLSLSKKYLSRAVEKGADARNPLHG